jgi:ApbE superfamily uncharacterized protein (UPF0280 family)
MKIYKTHFVEKESDITLISDSKTAISKAKMSFQFHRENLEDYTRSNPTFLKSFSPLTVNSDYKIIELMAEVAFICDVGPMAAVAGALADLMQEEMKLVRRDKDLKYEECRIALVENGGEIAIDSEEPMKIALYAGQNELNLNLGFLVKKEDCPLGIGTSSATVGHAISLGQSDAVTIFAINAALADPAATKVGNAVKGKDIEKSIKKGLDIVDQIEGVKGAFISRENKVGQIGKLPQLIKIEGDKNYILKSKLDDHILGDFEIYK